MSDIVERLRGSNDALLSCGNDYSDVLLDAANEVERLRAENAMLWCKVDALLAEIDALKSAPPDSEVERLKHEIVALKLLLSECKMQYAAMVAGRG